MVRIKANVGAATFPDNGNALQVVVAAADRLNVQRQRAARSAERQSDRHETLTRAPMSTRAALWQAG